MLFDVVWLITGRVAMGELCDRAIRNIVGVA